MNDVLSDILQDGHGIYGEKLGFNPLVSSVEIFHTKYLRTNHATML